MIVCIYIKEILKHFLLNCSFTYFKIIFKVEINNNKHISSVQKHGVVTDYKSYYQLTLFCNNFFDPSEKIYFKIVLVMQNFSNAPRTIYWLQ